jgi:hypothetical protein
LTRNFVPSAASQGRLSSLDGGIGFRLDGAATNDKSGHSVASAGDVNGDGFADLIIGAPGADPYNSGTSYVMFGKASGFTAKIDLSSLNGSNGFRLDGVSAGDFSGQSVAGAGDVNGDGFADVIVGAATAGVNYSGASYVVFGKATGFAASIDLSTLDGSNGFRLDGVAAYDQIGRSVATAGDVNGDGFGDLIVGAGAGAGAKYRGKYAEIARRPTHAELNHSWRLARELGLKFETTTFERDNAFGMPAMREI